MTRNLQWLNANAHRTYPFIEDGHLTIGSQQVPDDFLLDFQCTLYSMPQGVVRLLKILRYVESTQRADVTFRCSTPGWPDLDIVLVGLPVGIAATPYTYRVSSTAYEVAAVFGEGMNTWLADLALGEYDAVEYISGGRNLAIEPVLAVFHNQLQVTQIKGDSGPAVVGGVRLMGGYGVYVSVEPESNTLRLVGGPGLGLGYPSAAPSGRPLPNQILRGINGVYADGSGNIQLIGGNGVQITPDPAHPNTLLIKVATEKADIDCGSSS